MSKGDLKMRKSKIEKTLSFQELVAHWNKNHQEYSDDKILSLLKERIASFEAKYHIPTSEFAQRYDRGEFETDDAYPGYDLFVWRSSFRKYLELSAKMKRDQE